jgi:choline-sulfatase
VLRPGLPTVASALAADGYATCLVGKMHLGGRRQFAGFQYRPYGDLTGGTGHQWEPIPGAAKGMRERTSVAVGVTGIPESQMQEELVCREALAFLREHRHRAGDTPWFLCASFSRPHFPLTAPRRFVETYTPATITEPRVGPSGDAYEHPMSVGMREGFRAAEIDHAEMMRARAAYFACVAYLDEIVGDLLVRLEHDGLLDDTIVVYTTDHGEMAGEHGVWWKNGWYEACTRVPWIISTPGHRTGGRPAAVCRTPVGLGDLFPTLCGLAGATPPGGLDGRDLSRAVLDAAPLGDVPVICDNLIPRWGAGTEFRMLRYRQFKYVRFRNAAPLFFDLEHDPAEQVNLAGREVGREVAEVRAKMRAWADETMDFDAAERERLERDGPLHEQFGLDRSARCGNAYLMPDGRVVGAEQVLYAPNVIAEDACALFDDFGGGADG